MTQFPDVTETILAARPSRPPLKKRDEWDHVKEDRMQGLDMLTARERSELMSRIRSKDTQPEMRVRRLVHGMGYRYRLHAKDLPGCPDLVFRPRRKAIFVQGCFWHRHEGCARNRMPKTRRHYWRRKLNGNARRDRRNGAALEEMRWGVLIIWECETTDLNKIAGVIRCFLGPVQGLTAV